MWTHRSGWRDGWLPRPLPLTLGVLGAVLGGTAAGVALREHTLIAGLLIAAVWLAGTARGLLLVRRAEREGYACRLRVAGSGGGDPEDLVSGPAVVGLAIRRPLRVAPRTA